MNPSNGKNTGNVGANHPKNHSTLPLEINQGTERKILLCIFGLTIP
jgi:hypothetical protein